VIVNATPDTLTVEQPDGTHFEIPQSRTGRHALADAQLGRERSHGQFGVW
jgi:hypothetical protein